MKTDFSYLRWGKQKIGVLKIFIFFEILEILEVWMEINEENKDFEKMERLNHSNQPKFDEYKLQRKLQAFENNANED